MDQNEHKLFSIISLRSKFKKKKKKISLPHKKRLMLSKCIWFQANNNCLEIVAFGFKNFICRGGLNKTQNNRIGKEKSQESQFQNSRLMYVIDNVIHLSLAASNRNLCTQSQKRQLTCMSTENEITDSNIYHLPVLGHVCSISCNPVNLPNLACRHVSFN